MPMVFESYGRCFRLMAKKGLRKIYKNIAYSEKIPEFSPS
jgi:hypothetical protein